MAVSNDEGKRILDDVRKANNNMFEISVKSFIDFMTKKRINIAYVAKGFIDPLVA